MFHTERKADFPNSTEAPRKETVTVLISLIGITFFKLMRQKKYPRLKIAFQHFIFNNDTWLAYMSDYHTWFMILLIKIWHKLHVIGYFGST